MEWSYDIEFFHDLEVVAIKHLCRIVGIGALYIHICEAGVYVEIIAVSPYNVD